MFDIVRKLLSVREMEFESAKINLLKQPVVMMPLETYMGLQKKFEAEGRTIDIYRAAWDTGYKWFHEMKTNYGMDTIKSMLKWGSSILSLAGWGNLSTRTFDVDRKLVHYDFGNSRLCELYGPQKQPVCHLIRGYLAGGSAYMLGDKEIEAVETKCMSLGDPKCEFVCKPGKEFDLPDSFFKKTRD